MSDRFFRFPHTPHLAWLGPGQPRDDKVLAPDEASALLTGEVVVEEKVDGANIGISCSDAGALRVQNRGSYLERAHAAAQFRPLWPWLAAREARLIELLGVDRILFGEWCYATHSVFYDRLPDWFLGFDVYDRRAERFWDSRRRNDLLRELGLHGVPLLGRGEYTPERLRELVSGPSRVGSGAMEGVVVRQEEGGFTARRAKLVRAEFTQAIEEHWSRKPLHPNQLAPDAGSSTWTR